MTYFIIRDTLIMIYLFYYLHKKLNKMNGQKRSLEVKNDTFNGTEGVLIELRCWRLGMVPNLIYLYILKSGLKIIELRS